MSNALAIPGLTGLPSVDLNLNDYASEVDFFSRIQLTTFVSGAVKDGKITAGHYSVPQSGGEVVDLGESVDLIPFTVRNKALDTSSDPPLAVYDMTDPLYTDIKERAGEKDSGCMYGPSFLVYERNTGEFYELFLGNKTGRQEAGRFSPYLPVGEAQAEAAGVEAHGPIPLTLGSRVIKRKTQSWHAPVVHKCSTPFSNVPAAEVILAQVNKFLNPKSEAGEAAEGTNRSR